jgi:hypothetical protein
VVLREDQHGVIAIGQASHAWISGQLARAWGNPRFGPVQPYEEVCLAAEQHDVGMAQWDLAPSRNPSTGLPHSFTEMPLGLHVELWRQAGRRLLSQSRYASLLVTIHGRRLYQMRRIDELGPEQAALVRRFLVQQREVERALLDSLQADPATARFADPQLVACNSQLIWIWDLLSLALCLDWAPRLLREVPSADGWIDVQLETGARPGRCSLDPWPFTSATVTVRCEGQRLSGRYPSDEALRQALAQAPFETVEFELVQARAPWSASSRGQP